MTAITSAAMAMVRVFTGVLSSVGSLPQCPHIMPKIGRATPVHRVTAPSRRQPPLLQQCSLIRWVVSAHSYAVQKFLTAENSVDRWFREFTVRTKGRGVD